MAVAASEVCVGLGLVVAINRRKLSARRRHALGAARMTGITYGAWLCLLAPLAGTILILLGGTRLPRVAAGLDRDRERLHRVRRRRLGVPRRARAARRSAWDGHLRPAATESSRPRGRGSRRGSFNVPLQLLVDPLSTMMMLIVTGVGGADRPLLDRLHGRRRRGAALLRLHRLLRLLDAAARRGRQPAACCSSAGDSSASRRTC